MKMRIWNVAGKRRGRYVGRTSHPIAETEPEGKTAQWVMACGLRCWRYADTVEVRSRGRVWVVVLDGR